MGTNQKQPGSLSWVEAGCPTWMKCTCRWVGGTTLLPPPLQAATAGADPGLCP